MALMQITVIPLGTRSVSVGDFVAGIQKKLGKQDLRFTLTDMGTIVEGSAEALLAVAATIHEYPFTKGVKRVVTQIVIDDRRDKSVGIGDKITSVEDRLHLT
ncbi:MAG: MTH1187 family thiamine-binding protein [Proteobacteria bacterium]|nr:MTH1187 family thiamine-binding protein [Pseudomonadota bacterium]MBU1688778.1 MTH1187 family thiamine-binding protein [Pseudomonadota bacterium]